MLTHQATGFRSQLEDGEARRVVDVDRRVVKLLDLEIKLFPLVALQPSALDLLARDLADIYDQTIDQLDVAHLKREKRHGDLEVHRHVLGH